MYIHTYIQTYVYGLKGSGRLNVSVCAGDKEQLTYHTNTLPLGITKEKHAKEEKKNEETEANTRAKRAPQLTLIIAAVENRRERKKQNVCMYVAWCGQSKAKPYKTYEQAEHLRCVCVCVSKGVRYVQETAHGYDGMGNSCCCFCF